MRKNGEGKEENEEKWKQENEKLKWKKDSKKLMTFFSFLLFTFRKRPKLFRGLLKWKL